MKRRTEVAPGFTLEPVTHEGKARVRWSASFAHECGTVHARWGEFARKHRAGADSYSSYYRSLAHARQVIKAFAKAERERNPGALPAPQLSAHQVTVSEVVTAAGSIQAAATVAGIDRANLSRWKSGEHQPHPLVWAEACRKWRRAGFLKKRSERKPKTAKK